MLESFSSLVRIRLGSLWFDRIPFYLPVLIKLRINLLGLGVRAKARVSVRVKARAIVWANVRVVKMQVR